VTSGLRRPVAAVVVLVAAFAAYRAWNSDERQILRMLGAVAGIVSHDEPAAGVGALAEVAGLAAYLAPDVRVEPGAPVMPLAGAQDVVSTAARLRVAIPMLRLTFEDVEVSDVAGGTARVRSEARVTRRDPDFGDTTEARRLEIDVREVDGRWTIAAVRPALENSPAIAPAP
jgi:hypothetical protein